MDDDGTEPERPTLVDIDAYEMLQMREAVERDKARRVRFKLKIDKLYKKRDRAEAKLEKMDRKLRKMRRKLQNARY